jgi:hypothetical protein
MDEWRRDDAGRFGKGNKGGPGRPLGSKGFSIKAAIDRAIEESARDDGRSVVDALARVAIKAAADGDFRFWKELIDRIDGPVAQQIEADQTIVIERVSKQPNDKEDGDAGTDLPEPR